MRLLDTRARRYRNLVIAVVAVIFASAVLATAQWSLLPLLGLLSLPSLCGAFFSLDAASVSRWHIQCLSQWQAGELDIDDFGYALTHMKHLPTKTVETMLGLLPTRELVRASTGMTPALRQGLAATLTCIHSCQTTLTIAAAVAWAVGATSVAVATIAGSGVPCLGVLFVLPVLGVGALWRTLQLRRWSREVRELFPGGDGLPLFIEAAARLDWESIKEHRRGECFRSLCPDQELSEGCANSRFAPKTPRRG